MRLEKKDILLIISVSLIYCSLSAGFSLISTVLPDKTALANPIERGSLNIKEITGHFLWGVVAATVTLQIRYILLGGTLAVLIDSDHLVGLLHVEGLPRMSHSIAFAIIATTILVIIFRKSDYYILGAIIATSVLTHISYDAFDGEFGFPIFTPFMNKIIQFPKADWILFEIAAISILGIVSFASTRKRSEGKVVSI